MLGTKYRSAHAHETGVIWSTPADASSPIHVFRPVGGNAGSVCVLWERTEPLSLLSLFSKTQGKAVLVKVLSLKHKECQLA